MTGTPRLTSYDPRGQWLIGGSIGSLLGAAGLYLLNDLTGMAVFTVLSVVLFGVAQFYQKHSEADS